MADRKKSFVINTDILPSIEKLSSEDVGQLLIALLKYVDDGTLPDNLSASCDMAFSFIKSQIDRDKEKYTKVCAARSEAGKQGGRPPKTDVFEEYESKKSKKSNCFSEKQKKQKKAKKADSDSVSDSDSVNDSEGDGDSVLYTPAAAGKHNTTTHAHGKYNNVNLTDEEYQQLCDTYGKKVICNYTERISEYIHAKGIKAYSNHYQTMIKWLERDNVKNQQQLAENEPSFDLSKIMEHAKNTPLL